MKMMKNKNLAQSQVRNSLTFKELNPFKSNPILLHPDLSKKIIPIASSLAEHPNSGNYHKREKSLLETNAPRKPKHYSSENKIRFVDLGSMEERNNLDDSRCILTP